MKLGQLKSAIRAGKNPGVWVVDLDAFVTVQKTALIDVLDSEFGSKATETGLCLNSEGNLVREAGSEAPTLSSGTAISAGSVRVVGENGSGTLHWELNEGFPGASTEDDLFDEEEDLFGDDTPAEDEDDDLMP